jgi:branched-chain amino acid transport system permease protein
VLESAAEAYLGTSFKGVKEVAPFVVLMVILLFKPHGLFGQHRIERI